MISYKSTFRIRWDIFVLVLAVINGIYIPLKLSFDPPEMKTQVFKIFDIIVDIFFISDIVIHFFVTYINKKGNEVFQFGSIASNHFKSVALYFDLLSVLGIGLVAHINPLLRNFGFFKLFKILKIKNLINNSTMTDSSKAVANIFKLVLYLCIILNVIACFLYSVVLINSKIVIDGRAMKWYPPLDFINYNESKLFQDDYTLF